MTNNLGETPTEPPTRRERPRVVPPLELMLALCIIAFAILLLVSNSESQKRARASRERDRIAERRAKASQEMDRIAAMKPAEGSAWAEIKMRRNRILWCDYPKGTTLPLELEYGGGAVGEFYFGDKGVFAGGKNFISGKTYSAAETTVPR